jgi:flagellar basal-body rod modification protein FlgD
MTTPVNGSSGTGSTTGTASANPNSAAATQDKFLNLLVAQLQNQDPLNPMDNSQVTTQLAQINTVQGIETLNSTLQTLLGSYGTSQAMQATSLVGHDVLTEGSTLTLTDGAAVGGFTLDAPADSVTVTVTGPNGQVVHTATLSNVDAGTQTFQWDGLTDSGGTSAAGQYTFGVKATNQGQKVTSSTLSIGRVDGITNAATGPVLNTSNGAVTWDKVKQVI